MESFLRDLAEAQAVMGLALRVLVHAERPWRPGSEDSMAGVPVTRAAILGWLAFAPLSPGYALRLARLLREFRPDVIHAHLPNPSAFALLGLPSAADVPLVLHWHSDVVTEGSLGLALLHPPYRVLEQALLRRAQAVAATSAPYLEASAALAPHRAKCRVIPLGLDPARLHAPTEAEVARARAWAHNSFLLLAAGRFSHYKGFDVLVRAAGLLPEEARVVIVGDGPERAGLLRLARELGLEGRVRMPGSLPDRELHALMAACDCFCLPSVARAEAFGLVLAEAMAFGRPLICSRLPGSGMTVVNEEGVTGLAFAPGDAAGLAGAVRRLMADADLRERLGRAGRERFGRSLGISAVAQACSRLYAELTARATRRPRTDGGSGA